MLLAGDKAKHHSDQLQWISRALCCFALTFGNITDVTRRAWPSLDKSKREWKICRVKQKPWPHRNCTLHPHLNIKSLPFFPQKSEIVSEIIMHKWEKMLAFIVNSEIELKATQKKSAEMFGLSSKLQQVQPQVWAVTNQLVFVLSMLKNTTLLLIFIYTRHDWWTTRK